ncbi:hypothetical protein [Flavobacterium sp. GCM10023249]|uniref:hypothetical protein n=1 Tax=unclassified Flavobacterium TaxID=196869 RepID=UPI00361EFFA7
MKVYFTLFILLLYSCTTKSTDNSSEVVSPTVTKPTDTLPTDSVTAMDTLDASAEIIEHFVDSVHIGRKGQSKIELIKHRVLDDCYVIVKFYTKGPKYWFIQNTYFYECTALSSLEPKFSDYTNDGLNDITFISATAARGANEVRRLFVYDDTKKELVSIVNSQDFPNMKFNKQLNCIDAFLVHGTSTCVFAKINKDSLQPFAYVYNDENFHTVSLVDKNKEIKTIKKIKSKGAYVRFKNFNPLEEYPEE